MCQVRSILDSSWDSLTVVTEERTSMLVCWDAQEQLGHSLKQVGGVGRPPVVGGGSTEAEGTTVLLQTDGWWAGTGYDI